MSKFTHLHVHTQFSLLDGAAEISNLYKKAAKDGQPALAITDHGNMFGVFEFVAEAYKHKLNPDDKNDKRLKVKPIVGCEFYLVENRLKRQFTREEKDMRFHQVLLRQADVLSNLRAVSIASSPPSRQDLQKSPANRRVRYEPVGGIAPRLEHRVSRQGVLHIVQTWQIKADCEIGRGFPVALADAIHRVQQSSRVLVPATQGDDAVLVANQ